VKEVIKDVIKSLLTKNVERDHLGRSCSGGKGEIETVLKAM